MTNSWLRCGLLMTALLILSACGPGAAFAPPGTGAVSAWFDAPLPGTVFYPPNPCVIVAHGASEGGVSFFELTVAGQSGSIIPSPDTTAPLVTLTQDCGLSEPGVYDLRLRAQDNEGSWSGYAQTQVIIGGRAVMTASPSPAPLVIPTRTPTLVPRPLGGVSIESISSDLVYAGDGSCGPSNVTIRARATAPDGIQVVVLFYRFEPGSPAGFQNAAMSPAGADIYQVTVNPTAALGGPADATLQYQVVVQEIDGDTTIRTPVIADIAVEACGAPVDCSSYAGQVACENHGCSWVAGPGIIPVYSCQ